MAKNLKPVWSEEDDNMIVSAEALCDDKIRFTDFQDVKEHVNAIKNWIKSLKDRVQLKQEWSDEDEKYSSYICAALQCYYRLREDRNNTNGQEELDKARNWLYNRLKSLKPQPQWKPSDEQIMVFAKASETYCGIDKGVLYSLYNDLKKLREW